MTGWMGACMDGLRKGVVGILCIERMVFKWMLWMHSKLFFSWVGILCIDKRAEG